MFSDLKKIIISVFAQLANILIPLVLYPFLINAVSISVFGKLMSYVAFLSFFNNLSDLGITTVYARKISQTDSGELKGSLILESTVFKIILSFISSLLFIGFCYSMPIYSSDPSLIISTSFLIFCTGIVPNHYFLGIGQFQFSTIVFAVSKIFLVLGCLIFIKSSDQINLVNYINGISMLIVLLPFYYLIFKDSRFSELKLGVHVKLSDLKESINVFGSNLMTSLSVASIVFFLTMYTDESTVGLYSYSEKLFLGGKSFLGLYSTFLFTKLCNKKTDLKSLFRYYYFTFVGLIFLICLVVFTFTSEIIDVLRGPEEASEILRYIIWGLLVISLNIWGYQSLLAKGYFKVVRNTIALAVSFSIMIGYILISNFGVQGAIYTLIIGELGVLSVVCFSYLSKRQLNE